MLAVAMLVALALSPVVTLLPLVLLRWRGRRRGRV